MIACVLVHPLGSLVQHNHLLFILLPTNLLPTHSTLPKRTHSGIDGPIHPSVVLPSFILHLPAPSAALQHQLPQLSEIRHSYRHLVIHSRE